MPHGPLPRFERDRRQEQQRQDDGTHVDTMSTHVVLVHPEIHWNTGNAGRTCLAAGATLHLVETATGKWLPDEVRNRVREVDWLPDGSGFVYNNLEDLKDPFSRRIRFHKVGTDSKEDRVLLEQPKTGPAASTWGPRARTSSRRSSWRRARA